MRAAASILLLAAAVALVVRRPFGVPKWVPPLTLACVAFVTGLVSWEQISQEAAAMNPAILFLLAAVPLGVLLDRLGYFRAVADLVGGGRHLVRDLWIVAAIVTTVLNLDAAVVLLTPLYVRIARHRGLDPVALAFQPVLLALVASSALPVSNLTNLIVTERLDLSTVAFITHLALPSIAATTVGWFFYRRAFPVVPPAPRAREHWDRRAFIIGTVLVVLLLVAFVAGPPVGIKAWMSALAVDLVLIVIVRDVPWRAVPVSTGVVVGGLAVLAAAAAPHLPVADLLGPQDGVGAVLRAVGTGVGGAALMNNVPAVLVALPTLHASGDSLWGLLLGLNIGPALIITGSLASLLWLDSVHRLHLKISARDFSRVGIRVGIPALVAATVTLAALTALR